MMIDFWKKLPFCWAYVRYIENKRITTLYIWAFGRKWDVFSFQE